MNKALTLIAVALLCILLSHDSNADGNVCNPVVNVHTCKSQCQQPKAPKVKVIYKDRIVYKNKVVYKDRVVYRVRKVFVKVPTPVVTKVPVDRLVIKKRLVRVTKTKHLKNKISAVIGHGALGNLDVKADPSKVWAASETGPVVGLQYLRDVRVRNNYDLHLGVQAQTNRTLSVLLGVGF